jgi:hypothetical protein
MVFPRLCKRRGMGLMPAVLAGGLCGTMLCWTLAGFTPSRR